MSTHLGTFILGGCPWNITVDNEYLEKEGKVYTYHTYSGLIRLRDNFNGVYLKVENLERAAFEAITREIILNVMFYKKLQEASFLKPYSAMIYQVYKQLHILREANYGRDKDCEITIGGRVYTVRVDNDECEKSNFYGMLCTEEALIILGDRISDDELYSNRSIEQTFWHEVCHAISYELGMYYDKINSEKFVNTFATFINEVTYSFYINDKYNERDKKESTTE